MVVERCSVVFVREIKGGGYGVLIVWSLQYTIFSIKKTVKKGRMV